MRGRKLIKTFGTKDAAKWDFRQLKKEGRNVKLKCIKWHDEDWSIRERYEIYEKIA